MPHAAAVGNRRRAGCVIWRGRLAPFQRSGGGSRVGTGLPGEGLLLVVKLDVGLIQQGDIEAEGEVAVRGLQKREARVPAVQITLEANGVGAELPCVEIVVRIPRRRPICGRLEREAKSQLLAPRARADES